MASIKAVWRCIASGNEPLQRSSQCFSVVQSTAYIFGGELKPREPRDNAVHTVPLHHGNVSPTEAIKKNTISNAPLARVGSASARLGNDIFFFGGRGGVSMTCLESKGCFDVLHTDGGLSWSVIKPSSDGAPDALPEDRSYHSMTSDNDHTIYVHAGCPSQGRLNDFWAFDTTSLRWQSLASAPGGGRGGTSLARASNGKLYRINGFDGKSEQGGSVDVYDPKTNEWNSIKYQPDGINGPEPRSVSVLVPVKSKWGPEYLVTMFGEGSPSDLGHAGAGRMFGDIWAFDVSAETWHQVDTDPHEKRPHPRGWFDADVWTGNDQQGDIVIVHGGLHDDNSRLDDVWTLELESKLS